MARRAERQLAAGRMYTCEVCEMFSLIYGLLSAGDSRYPSHRLCPREVRDAHWRQAYAEMQRELRRTAQPQDSKASPRRGVPWRLSWPFIGQR